MASVGARPFLPGFSPFPSTLSFSLYTSLLLALPPHSFPPSPLPLLPSIYTAGTLFHALASSGLPSPFSLPLPPPWLKLWRDRKKNTRRRHALHPYELRTPTTKPLVWPQGFVAHVVWEQRKLHGLSPYPLKYMKPFPVPTIYTIHLNIHLKGNPLKFIGTSSC